LERTEQKHLKKQKSCRDQRPSQNNKTTDEKSEKAPTKKFVTAAAYIFKEEKQRVEELSLFILPCVFILSRTKAQKRQKWWCVFDRWKVSSLVSHPYPRTLNAR